MKIETLSVDSNRHCASFDEVIKELNEKKDLLKNILKKYNLDYEVIIESVAGGFDG